MSKRKSDKPLEKVTLNLFKGDFARLGELHPQIGASVVIREMISAHIRSVDETVARTAPSIEITLPPIGTGG